jgi:DME family drug/metabolite transporter
VLGGLVLIALAAISWGTTGSVTTLLVTGAGAHPLLIGAARTWIGALLLVAAARAVGGPVLPRGTTARWIAMGACMAGFQASYFTAVTLTGIAVTALIAICSAPLIIAAVAWHWLGERPTPRTATALALGVTGTALLIAGPGAPGQPTGPDGAGVALALAAGAFYALYVIAAKSALARAAPLPLTAATFVAAAAFMTPLAALTTTPLEQVARGWPWLLYLGTVATAVAYGLYAAGLRRVPASAAGITTLLEPLTATLLAVLVFGERLSAAGSAGAVLLLGGLAVLATQRRP